METKRTASPFALAVLSEQIQTSLAPADEIGFASLSLQQSDDGWCQILPAGYFKAIDGRPFDVPGGHWFLDEPTAQILIAELTTRDNPVVIDYEHQTLLTDTNGQPAPASGWFKDAEWRESGLWIKPDWTGRARDFIANEEYRFLSAVFPYDKKTGKPHSLHSVALVNRPGLDGLNSVALRSLHISSTHHHPTQKEEPLMDLKKIITALGLPEGTTEDTALTALAALKIKADEADSVSTELAALKAAEPNTASNVDLTQYVPVTVVASLKEEMAALSAKASTSEVEVLVKKAIEDGRLYPAEEEWALEVGAQDMAYLKAYIDKQSPLAALKGMQAGHEKPPEQKGEHGLTDEELNAATLTGRTPEEFAALKAQ